MNTLVVIIFIAIAIGFYFIQMENHQNRINSQIELMGGKVESIEKRNFFTGVGPFMVVGKGRTVYRIKYIINNEVKEGWVRFGGLMGPDWRL